MRKVRTQKEIEASQYISQAEIQRWQRCGPLQAKKIYTAAEQVDIDELGLYRPWNTRVRLRSVYKVLGLRPTRKNTPLSGE